VCGREQLIGQEVHSNVECLSDVTICDLEAVAAKSNINISSLMSEAYHAIGDPDGIYGCSTDRHRSTVARLLQEFLNIIVIIRYNNDINSNNVRVHFV